MEIGHSEGQAPNIAEKDLREMEISCLLRLELRHIPCNDQIAFTRLFGL